MIAWRVRCMGPLAWSLWCDLFCLWERVRRKECGGGKNVTAGGKGRKVAEVLRVAAPGCAGARGAQDDKRPCPLRLCLLREGAAGWLGDGGFVVGRVEDYAAVEAFAIAFCAEVGLIAQGEVDDAALARGHGSEVERGSGLAYFFGGDVGGHAKFLQADGTLVLAVERNLFMLGRRQME